MTDQITRKSSDDKSLCAKLFGTKAEANMVLAEECKYFTECLYSKE